MLTELKPINPLTKLWVEAALSQLSLVPLLRNLGFSAVAFSYPQQARLGSSSLAWSSDSRLVDFKPTELVEAFDAVDDLRSLFPVNNPRASVADMKQHLAIKSGRFCQVKTRENEYSIYSKRREPESRRVWIK
jgi:hypothetical protein